MKEDNIENNYNMHFETGSNPTIFNNAKIEVHGDFITTSVKKPKPTNEDSREAHGEIPQSLATDKAKEFWRKLMEAGFVDKHCQRCKGVSRQIAMYIADCMADALKLPNRWKPFEQLWNMNNLAQEKKRMQDTGNRPQRAEEIDKIFYEE